MRELKAKRHMPSPRTKTEGAVPMTISDKANMTREAISGPRLLNRETSQPETGSPARELKGISSNRLPSWASFKAKTALMVGIRDVHAAKQKPERKKYTPMKMRWRLLDSMGHKNRILFAHLRDVWMEQETFFLKGRGFLKKVSIVTLGA
jgi:hypothetical protein